MVGFGRLCDFGRDGDCDFWLSVELVGTGATLGSSETSNAWVAPSLPSAEVLAAVLEGTTDELELGALEVTTLPEDEVASGLAETELVPTTVLVATAELPAREDSRAGTAELVFAPLEMFAGLEDGRGTPAAGPEVVPLPFVGNEAAEPLPPASEALALVFAEAETLGPDAPDCAAGPPGAALVTKGEPAPAALAMLEVCAVAEAAAFETPLEVEPEPGFPDAALAAIEELTLAASETLEA